MIKALYSLCRMLRIPETETEPSEGLSIIYADFRFKNGRRPEIAAHFLFPVSVVILPYQRTLHILPLLHGFSNQAAHLEKLPLLLVTDIRIFNLRSSQRLLTASRQQILPRPAVPARTYRTPGRPRSERYPLSCSASAMRRSCPLPGNP